MLPEQRDSITNTFVVTLVLCVACSLMVSTAAVALKEVQGRNKILDRQRNIIAAAGLHENPNSMSANEVSDFFKPERIEQKLVDLATGKYEENPEIANDKYDERKAAKDEKLNATIKSERFNIGISKREKYAWVYLIKGDGGKLEQVVLPIYGKGLWSTMYGFVAIKSDLKTINGLTYYEHGETPGLGGEVDNKKWKSMWIGKQIWNGEMDDENLRVGVAKGTPTGENANFMVDGLSGATITSRGVDSMLKYWLSSDAFGPFLKSLVSK